MDHTIRLNLRLRTALRHGWFVLSWERDGIWLERLDGKCKGTLYLTPEGHLGYCPF